MGSGFRSMKPEVKRFQCTAAGRRTLRRARRPRLSAAAMVVAMVGWSCFAVAPSYARVNPLVVIERQLHKANMLIILDTSGSMTGVPGGQFANSTEAGVDCDNGAHCRNGGVQGLCKLWGRVCMSDDDCRTGYCQKDGVTACSTSD